MSDGLNTLIAHLDEAVRLGDPAAITAHVKTCLETAIHGGAVTLPERLRQPRAEGYARRLLHRNDELGYTAVVMTWGPGQQTPLHDHAGIWCVEGVVQGRIDVTQYDLVAGGDERFQFESRGCVHADVGSAGCLIPPFEYHVIANVTDRPAVTLHVYGGEMSECHVFEPAPGGGYLRRARPLCYHE